MSGPSGQIPRLYRSLLRPAPGAAFAVLRVGTASVLLAKLIAEFTHLDDIYGNNGLAPWMLSEIQLADFAPRMSWVSDLLSRWLVNPEQHTLRCVVISYAAALILMLFSLGGRWPAAVAWLTHLMLLGSGGLSAYGVDTFGNIALFYSFVMPYGCLRESVVTMGLSSRNALWLRLLQLHMIVVYVVAGTAKARGAEWWNGEAIWRSLMQPQFRVFDYSWLAYVPAIPTFVGWLTVVIEIGYPFGMMCRRIRPLWLAAVVGLHIGIGSLMGLRSFAAIMIVLNLAAFGGEFVRRVAGRIARRD